MQTEQQTEPSDWSCKRCKWHRASKDWRFGIVCGFCGDGTDEPLRPSVLRRFYFADGHVKYVTVDKTMRDAVYMEDPRYFPEIWLVREFPPMDMTPPMGDASFRVVQRTFRRRDYAYRLNFIGPTRDFDYHEESSNS